MWRIGERPSETQFAELNEPQVVPQGMDGWYVHSIYTHIKDGDGWRGEWTREELSVRSCV